MLGQSQSHRWRAVVIATHTIDQRQPQGPMGAMKVVIEELQADEGTKGGIAFGKGVRFAGERIEPVAQSPVESFDMHGARWLDQHPQRGTGLHREQVSVLITMLDGLCQADRLWDHQARTPPFPRQHPLAIGPLQDAPIALPTITEPVQFALMGPLDRDGHRLFDQILA